MTIDHGLIRDALLRTSPADLDEILATIEAYRTCVITANRMRGSQEMRQERRQVLQSAGYYRKTLKEYSASGQLRRRAGPESGEARFLFILAPTRSACDPG